MGKKPSHKELEKKIRELEQATKKLEQTEETVKSMESFASKVLNALSAHIAILDENGVIVETNRAWQAFASSNDLKMSVDTVGVNYIELCEAAAGDDAEEAHDVAKGIRHLIDGTLDEFVIDYPCHSPTEKRWFYMKATRLSGPGPRRVVVSHEDVTAIKLAEEDLKIREAELRQKTANLEEANIALKVLLHRREEDKRELEETIVSNVKELIMPYMEKIENTNLGSRQKAYLDLIKNNLEEVVSPFIHELSSRFLKLTPQEIQVANLVKAGKSTKEISELLSISINAVNFHRKNVREKLGLKGKKTNLRTFLLTLK